MGAKNLYLVAFAIAVGIIAYFDITKCHKPPWPPRLIYTGLVFLVLDIFAIFSEELAGVMALGVVIAMAVKKGFVSDCSYIETGTAQPAQYAFLGDTTAQANYGSTLV